MVGRVLPGLFSLLFLWAKVYKSMKAGAGVGEWRRGILDMLEMLSAASADRMTGMLLWRNESHNGINESHVITISLAYQMVTAEIQGFL